MTNDVTMPLSIFECRTLQMQRSCPKLSATLKKAMVEPLPFVPVTR